MFRYLRQLVLIGLDYSVPQPRTRRAAAPKAVVDVAYGTSKFVFDMAIWRAHNSRLCTHEFGLDHRRRRSRAQPWVTGSRDESLILSFGKSQYRFCWILGFCFFRSVASFRVPWHRRVMPLTIVVSMS